MTINNPKLQAEIAHIAGRVVRENDLSVEAVTNAILAAVSRHRDAEVANPRVQTARQLAHEHEGSMCSEQAHSVDCDHWTRVVTARDRQYEAALAVLAGIARPNGVLCRTCGDTVETCDMDNNPGDECAGKLARGFFASSESAAPAGTAPTPIMCDWCGGRGHGLLDEAGFVACPKCKGTGAVITVPAAAPAQEVAHQAAVTAAAWECQRVASWRNDEGDMGPRPVPCGECPACRAAAPPTDAPALPTKETK